MNAVKKYTSTSKLPFRCFFPLIIWPGAVVLHTKSVMFRLLIFFALILSVINNIIVINIVQIFTFICGSLPAVTGFLKIILVFRVQLPLRGTRCWSTEVILTPSIMPLVTFSSFFITKEVNFVPEGNRGSLVFTKDVTGTSSMLPATTRIER